MPILRMLLNICAKRCGLVRRRTFRVHNGTERVKLFCLVQKNYCSFQPFQLDHFFLSYQAYSVRFTCLIQFVQKKLRTETAEIGPSFRFFVRVKLSNVNRYQSSSSKALAVLESSRKSLPKLCQNDRFQTSVEIYSSELSSIRFFQLN